MAPERFTVLVVDDSEADRIKYRRYLQRNPDLNCAVFDADSGEEGLSLCQRVCPEVILLDYLLPDMNGVEFLEALKSRMGQPPALVMVTGQGSESVATRTLKAGAEDYLVKGHITPILLQHSIEQAMDRVTLRRQLAESETQLRRAVEEAPFPIIIHSEDGQILQMSRAVSDISGYAASDIQTIGDWTEKAYGERQENALENINRLYKLDRRVDEGESEITTRSGEARTWLFSSAPLGQRRDGVRMVISMAADVTAQKQAEADLSARLRQQAAIAQLSQLALTGLELSTLFDHTTQMLAAGLGVNYCKVMALVPNEQSLLLSSGVGWQHDLVGKAQVSIGRRSQAGYTLLCQGPVVVEDLRRESRFSGSTLLTEQGIVSGMSAIIQSQGRSPFGVLEAHATHQRTFTPDDVNFLQAAANLLATAIARKQSEQALEQLNITLEQRVQERTKALEDVNQELEAFSYSVAHDLRAPLRAIQGFAQVLEEDCGAALDDLGREYIHRMAKSAETLDALVQDLLTYSRLGRSQIELQCLSLDAVVKRTLTALESTIQAKQAQIEIAPMPHVYAQRTVLRQVISNLLLNALKFTAPGQPPQIRVWAERVAPSHEHEAEDSRVRVWVADRGIGIAPQHQERIFKPFERLHGVEAYSGTGIGLSIVKRGVQRMGGRVGVKSAVGQGSQFWFELSHAAL